MLGCLAKTTRSGAKTHLRFSVLCNRLSQKHEVQLSKTEVSKDTSAIGLSAPQSPSSTGPRPPLKPLARGSHSHPHWEPGRSPQPSQPSAGRPPSFTPRVLGSSGKAGLAGGCCSPGCSGLLVQARENLACDRRQDDVRVLSSTHWGKSRVVWVCVPACCCCYSMATGSNRINGVPHSGRSH